MTTTSATPAEFPAAAPIRNAATVVVFRRIKAQPHVLMGQRGATAAFMPDKFVFPGGAVEQDDFSVPLLGDINPTCRRRLAMTGPDELVHALQVAALRELYEETGLKIGRAAAWVKDVPATWAGFAACGLRPSTSGLRFLYRAITPPEQPRRFDARFFLADAALIDGDMDDFSGADAELSLLQWVPLATARQFNLPFITHKVLDELESVMADPAAPRAVPSFHKTPTGAVFDQIT